jgi:hypothetical protein
MFYLELLESLELATETATAAAAAAAAAAEFPKIGLKAPTEENGRRGSKG